LVEKGIYSEQNDSFLMLWYMVRDALLEEIKKSSSITIHMGKTIESYDDTTDQSQIEVLVKDVGGGNEAEKLLGLLLVAADGVYSNIRKIAGLEPAKFATKTKWRGVIPHVPKESILRPFLDKGITPLMECDSTKGMRSGDCVLNLFNFHPKIDRKCTFVMNASVMDVPPGTHPRDIFRKTMTDPFHQQVLEEIYELADDRELRYPLAMAVIELHDTVNKRWGGKGRVVLIGDAAHAMRPASGLGGSMAFEDSVVLCRLLEKGGISSLTTKESAEALVHEFEESRFDRVKCIWDDQWDISEKVYTDAPDEEWSKSFAEWVRQGV
jgi:2-polyprenyl-6-methoxyphenol hydroxylase-like FAD-dependent oxidoreductase